MLDRISPGIGCRTEMDVMATVADPIEIRTLADWVVRQRLLTIPGVAQVSVVGNIEREMTVEVQPQALEASGVSVSQVVQALQSQNLAAPVGRLNGELEERTIRLQGRAEGPADFAKIVVAERQGGTVRLGQVAKVYDGSEEPRTLALYDNRQAVGLEIGLSATDRVERDGIAVGTVEVFDRAGPA